MQNVFQLLRNNTYILSLLFLFSCATPDLRDKAVVDKLAKACLKGEGRGRINIKGKKYLFSFETDIKMSPDKKEKVWVSLMEFPLHGSEMLAYRWKGDKWRVEGSFLAALKNFLNQSKQNLTVRELDQMLAGLAEIIRLSNKVTQESRAEPCLVKRRCPVPLGIAKTPLFIDWHHEENNLVAQVNLPDSRRNIRYQVVFSNPSSSGYKQMSLRVRGEQGFDKNIAFLDYDLFWTRLYCQ